MPFRIGGWTMLARYEQSGTERIFAAGVRSRPMQVRIYGSGAAGDRFLRESQLEPIRQANALSLCTLMRTCKENAEIFTR